jgi:hypothetical protein
MASNIPEGVSANNVAKYDRIENTLKAHVLTNRILAQITAAVQPQVELFSQQKNAEIEAMTEAELKNLLKPHRKPTPLTRKVTKGLQRAFRTRTSNNSRRELIDLARQTYIPTAIRDYHDRIWRSETQVAVAPLTDKERQQLQDEREYIERSQPGSGWTRVKTYPPYWLHESEIQDRLSMLSTNQGLMGGRRTRRSRR